MTLASADVSAPATPTAVMLPFVTTTEAFRNGAEPRPSRTVTRVMTVDATFVVARVAGSASPIDPSTTALSAITYCFDLTGFPSTRGVGASRRAWSTSLHADWTTLRRWDVVFSLLGSREESRNGALKAFTSVTEAAGTTTSVTDDSAYLELRGSRPGDAQVELCNDISDVEALSQ
jgi:hypothetical protein